MQYISSDRCQLIDYRTTYCVKTFELDFATKPSAQEAVKAHTKVGERGVVASLRGELLNGAGLLLRSDPKFLEVFNVIWNIIRFGTLARQPVQSFNIVPYEAGHRVKMFHS